MLANNMTFATKQRVLIIDDDANWRELWKDALKQQACSVEFAKDIDEALRQLDNPFDLVVLNVLLRDEFYDGWFNDVTRVLDRISARKMALLMVTGSSMKDPQVFSDLLELQRRYRDEIRDTQAKRDLRGTFKMREVLRPHMSLLSSEQGPQASQSQSKPPVSQKDRTKMFSLAICASHGQIEIDRFQLLGDNGLQELTQCIQPWLEQVIEESGDAVAQTAWKTFRIEPNKSLRQQLVYSLIRHHCPSEAVLFEHVGRLQREIHQRKGADLYHFLSEELYDTHQVRDICTRLDPTHAGLDSDANQQTMARWIAVLARTQQQIMQSAIYYMMEINPIALLLERP